MIEYRSDYNSNVKPLIIEASDNGKGKMWTKVGGHLWDGSVVVGYTDGSSVRKEGLNENGELKVKMPDGSLVDLCVSTPGKNGWPESAKYAPATPVN